MLRDKLALSVTLLEVIPVIVAKDYAKVAEILKNIRDTNLRGELCEALVAEVYSTIRRNFR